MEFINPTEVSNIPTYRVMDSDGVLVDKTRKPLDIPKEKILEWYKNMLTGRWELILYGDYLASDQG